jgi:hypothetical protein
LGWFIRDSLATGHVTWGHKLYEEYKEYAQGIAVARPNNRPKRKYITYNGFMHYLYLTRRLGLTVYVLKDDGTPQGESPRIKSSGTPQENKPLVQTSFFKISAGKEADPAWDDLWEALYPRKSGRSTRLSLVD